MIEFCKIISWALKVLNLNSELENVVDDDYISVGMFVMLFWFFFNCYRVEVISGKMKVSGL